MTINIIKYMKRINGGIDSDNPTIFENPRAAIINNNGNVHKISGSEKNTTNNKMELMAPIKALQKIEENEKIEIYTDSKYVKLGITEWIHKWIKNNWQTSKKEPVKNK